MFGWNYTPIRLGVLSFLSADWLYAPIRRSACLCHAPCPAPDLSWGAPAHNQSRQDPANHPEGSHTSLNIKRMKKLTKCGSRGREERTGYWFYRVRWAANLKVEFRTPGDFLNLYCKSFLAENTYNYCISILNSVPVTTVGAIYQIF